MNKKRLGCIGWIMLILFLPLILGFAIIGGIIYGMVYGYKNGKFDNITEKTNEIICNLYNKVFKKELSKPILSPKGFTIITTVLIFLVLVSFGSTEEAVDTEVTSNQVVSDLSSSDGNDNTETEKTGESLQTENVIESTNAEIHFINTGNSDAILIKQGSLAALIDAGDNDDEGRVVSYLKQQGVTELEYVFATHPHADHIGGLDAVVDEIPIKNIYVSNGDADTQTYSDFINSMASKGLNPSVPLINNEFKFGTSAFKVLSVANESDPNNNSLVLLYTNGKDKTLLMGDAESEIEGKINVEGVDLLKVGHHGSHSSSSSSFIDKVNPKYAVITVGENNKYGHPHKETMDTLESRDIEVHRSDECGDIVFKSSGNGITVDCKEGSYEAGESEESEDSNNVSKDTYENSNIDTPPTPEPIQEPEVSENAEIVYWTSGGSRYHNNPNCSNMNSPMSGTISESGRTPCKKCY